MNHAYLMLLDTSLRTFLHNQSAPFPLSAALNAAAKLKYNPAVKRTFVRKGKIIQVIPATSLF